jgi:hypothetical protein
MDLIEQNIKCCDAIFFFNLRDVEVANASSFLFMQKTGLLDIKTDTAASDGRRN